MTKKCSKCGEVKDLSEFGKDCSKKDGHHSVCKKCVNAYAAKYYVKNKEKMAEWSKKYYVKNKEKMAERCKKYRAENKEKLAEKKKKYRAENKEKEAGRCKKYRAENKEKIVERKKKYCAENKEKIAERCKKHYANDIEYRIICNLRSRVRIAIKSQYGKKAKKTIELLGCSVSECRSYLEKQFTEGMTWGNNNMHGWHIDHIRPCASFDLTDLEQQKQCFHYTNLQPLWAKDNLSKGAKYEGVDYKGEGDFIDK